MNRILFKSMATIMALSLILSACKKKSDPSPSSPDDTAEQEQQSADVSNVSSSLDQALNDANNYISGTSVAGAREENVCSVFTQTNFTVDSAKVQGKKVFNLHHSGMLNCLSGLVISGTLTISADSNVKWSAKGAQVTLTFTNYSVRRPNGNVYVFNGSKTITNTTGGLLKTLPAGSSLTHEIQSVGTLSILFPDGTIRSWSTHRARTWTNNGNGNYSFSISGLGSASETGSSYSNVAFWGINRAGNAFSTVISQPVTYNSSCYNDPVSGQETHYCQRTLTATFGVDQNGNQITYTPGTSSCPWGYLINWTNASGTARSAIIQY